EFFACESKTRHPALPHKGGGSLWALDYGERGSLWALDYREGGNLWVSRNEMGGDGSERDDAAGEVGIDEAFEGFEGALVLLTIVGVAAAGAALLGQELGGDARDLRSGHF